MVKRFIDFPVMRFINSAILPVWGMLFLTLIAPVIVRYYIGNGCILATIVSFLIALMTTITIIFFVGLPVEMKMNLKQKAIFIIQKKR